MSLGEITILLFVVGAALIVAEAALPAQGIIGLLGLLSVLGGIGTSFAMNEWFGLAMLFGVLAATPLLWARFVRLWPKTLMGRHIILPPVPTVAAAPAVAVGQFGRTVSEMRPTGMCQFGRDRMEAISDCGIIAAGQNIVVVNIEGGRPTVRPAAAN